MFPRVRVHNVVVSACLGVELNLDVIADALSAKVRYRSGRLPRLVFKFESSRVAVLLFGSGRLICVGARSKCEAEKAVLKVTELLRSLGMEVEKPEIAVRNVVASADLRRHVDLEDLCERAGGSASGIIYEPEQFPQLIFRMDSPRTVFLIFSNGKIVCLGAKSTEEVRKAFKKLKSWLKQFVQ